MNRDPNRMLPPLDYGPSTPRGLEGYIRMVHAYPVLSAERERALLEKFHFENDFGAAKEVLLCHLRFVVSVAKKFSGYGLMQADLIQEGNIGLMKAIKKFEPGHGVRLIAFAVHWIKAEIYEFVLKNWHLVKIATTKAQKKLFFNLKKLQHFLGNSLKPSSESIASHLNLPLLEVKRMEERLLSKEISFDAPILSQGPNFQAENRSNPATLQNALIDPNSNFASEFEEAQWMSHLASTLRAGLLQLDSRSREILSQRWLTDKKMTLQAISVQYGVSIERIRQIEKGSLQQLKNYVRRSLKLSPAIPYREVSRENRVLKRTPSQTGSQRIGRESSDKRCVGPSTTV